MSAIESVLGGRWEENPTLHSHQLRGGEKPKYSVRSVERPMDTKLTGEEQLDLREALRAAYLNPSDFDELLLVFETSLNDLSAEADLLSRTHSRRRKASAG